jgi:hypothetical protein
MLAGFPVPETRPAPPPAPNEHERPALDDGSKPAVPAAQKIAAE